MNIQVVSVSIPEEFHNIMTLSGIETRAGLLSLGFELGIKWTDAQLWEHNSKDVFALLEKDASLYGEQKTPCEFSVSRRAYLKCMFTAKEYNLSFYDLSCWCVMHGFFLIRGNLRSGMTFEDMCPNWAYRK